MWIRGERLETTMGRAAAGLVVGGATGAVITVIGWLGFMIIQSDEKPPVWQVLPSAVILAIPVFLVWMLGAFTLGAGGWTILHSLRLRGGLTAALYGGLLNFVVGYGISGGRSLLFAGLLGLAGVAAGLATWRFSYRNPTPRLGEVFA